MKKKSLPDVYKIDQIEDEFELNALYPTSRENDKLHPYVNILDTAIQVFANDAGYSVEILHKPTGLICKERSHTIYKARCAAMEKLNSTLEERVNNKELV